MKDSTTDLGQGSISKLLWKLAIPAIVAQLINALYNIVDRIYIGNMPGGEGHLALAGLTVAFPIVMLVSAFASLMAFGGAPIAAIFMGSGDKEKAENMMGNCFTLLVATSIVLTIVLQLVKTPLLFLVGASNDTIMYAESYLSIYLFGTIAVLIALGMNAFINTQGFSAVGMKTVLIGAVMNIILDPIFIYVFEMGVEGAAIATVISQTVSAIWAFCFLIGKKTNLKLKKKYLKLKSDLVKSALALGVSPFAMMSTESLINIVLNATLSAKGGDIYVTVMGILSSVMMFAFMPLQGLGQGAQPIVSYNYGAKNYHRVKDTYFIFLKSALGMMVIMFVGVMIFTPSIVRIFNGNEEVIRLAVPSLRIYMAGIIAMGAQIACQQTFLATGQAKISLILALLRKVFLLIPLALLFANIWGADGVFIAEPVADIVAATITCIMFIKRRSIIFPKDDKIVE